MIEEMEEFNKAVEAALEPIYQKQCADFEGMMTELPIGSYVKMAEHTYQIVMPLNGITDMFGGKSTIVFEAKALAQVYKDAMHFLVAFQRGIEE